ncbi:hypothetical protein LIER_40444 [Lithospermum erythrorhizon]|uniref:Uncharacterized protein n=1 Tax=Lithospermum erythrorhizon TaxID=34254 RepID=A0AAV3QUU2_LITER
MERVPTLYMRRDYQCQAKVRGHILNNQWVIPYNPSLLADCHINVEVCCDIRVVKYLYKYIREGHGKIMFYIASDNQGTGVDEISDFQNARWVLRLKQRGEYLHFLSMECIHQFYNYRCT